MEIFNEKKNCDKPQLVEHRHATYAQGEKQDLCSWIYNGWNNGTCHIIAIILVSIDTNKNREKPFTLKFHNEFDREIV